MIIRRVRLVDILRLSAASYHSDVDVAIFQAKYEALVVNCVANDKGSRSRTLEAVSTGNTTAGNGGVARKRAPMQRCSQCSQ